MKDNFSTRSGAYRKFRPEYPQEVYEFIQKHLKASELAWDCGTGNGQVAGKLAEFFGRVEATDISKNQIAHAVKRPNINYSIQAAENTSFPNNVFDLLTTAQAFHWFDFDQFYSEVQRCLKPNALIAILGYGLFSSKPATNLVIEYFYNEIIGPYWDPERKYLDEAYKSIPFPFEEIETPGLIQSYNWSIEHLVGYLRTWSAVKHYERKNGKDPVEFIEKDLRTSFGKSNEVNFPILFRLGKNRKG
ncbi:class I SAM-dependent methyltransferase [Pontixanthobacter gangjinensis]|uniref:Class I SAM-dependent methyltransferase n=1 Tax=Christiangramia aestuarii TaxID=1028746 RepID=A0A7K1LPL9_9FLAO|nr:class I SAM-dependent methyltransferase [Christiangramia aestuarii]MUP42688.1 class I SAM-dependent methyltransferase [Christiangramia aestuarii]